MDPVKVELTDEIKYEFTKIGDAVNLVKNETQESIKAVKAEMEAAKTAREASDKKLGDLEGKINLVVKNTPAPPEDRTRGYHNLTEFFADVIKAGRNLDRPDLLPEKLIPLAANTVGSDEARQGSNPDGGYLIPPAYLADLLSVDPAATQYDTGALTRKVPMAADTVYVNARVDKTHTSSVSGGFRVYRRAETDTVTATKGTFEQIKLQANSLMGLSYASEEVLARSPISFAALIQTGFNDEKVSKLNYERIWGTGVGEFCGVMNSAAKIEVAKEGSQTADTIVGNNLIKMRARAWRYGNCAWMANHDTLTQLMAAHIVGTNGDVFLYAPGNGTDKPETLLGRPVIFDENCATLGDAGDILLINWQEYLEGMLGGATFMESIHVRFVYNERAFRFTVYNDGQPWWRSALTPKKSSTTLSPYVALAARA